MLLQVIHITKRTLILTRKFGNPLLRQGWVRDQQRKAQKHSGQSEEWRLHWVNIQLIEP